MSKQYPVTTVSKRIEAMLEAKYGPFDYRTFEVVEYRHMDHFNALQEIQGIVERVNRGDILTVSQTYFPTKGTEDMDYIGKDIVPEPDLVTEEQLERKLLQAGVREPKIKRKKKITHDVDLKVNKTKKSIKVSGRTKNGERVSVELSSQSELDKLINLINSLKA